MLSTNVVHPVSQLFVQLLVVIAASRVAGRIFTKFGVPAVVGEMTAGILLGPSLFGWMFPRAFGLLFPEHSLGALTLLSQIGICLFMFSVGMELDVAQVRNRARSAVAVSHTSIILPFAFGVMLAYPLYESFSGARATFTSFALFMGVSMSITAFPVLARILQDRRLTHTAVGSTAIACAAVEDVTAWCIMAFVVAVATSDRLGGVVLKLAMVVLFIVIMILGVRRKLPSWLGNARVTAAEPSTGTLSVVACLVIASAFTTEVLGIHALFGAFLAGTIMPDKDSFRRRIGERLEKFSSAIFLPLFFALTGLRTQFSLLGTLGAWLLCALIIVLATLGKLGAGAVAARATGMSWRESLQLGALLNTRGLVELIALNIGYDLGILSPSIFTMLVIMALTTTFLTGPLLTAFGPAQNEGVVRLRERSAVE